MYYALSIGTNINPECNAVNIIQALCHEFGSITLYPFVRTAPEHIDTHNTFLNALAIISSHLEAQELKDTLNSIETQLGRDRTDPDKSVKDRTADIDILDTADTNNFCFDQYPEQHIKQVIYPNGTTVDLSQLGLPPTQGPTTIHLDTGSGNIVVVD